MRRQLFIASVALCLFVGGLEPAAQRPTYRTLNDTFDAPRYTSVEEWKTRAAYLREHILASAGLLPMPARTPLNAVIFGEVRHPDYTVSKVYFESLPGFLVTGNLYRPIGNGPFPAILSPHGHWAYGRLENTSVVSAPGRAINLARQGFVVFLYDLVGYNDSRQLEHRLFGGRRENMWGLSVGGLQIWNGIRGLDFLQELPYVRRDAIGATGESGGGTQTFLIAAVDDRVAVAAPVNMISLHMQGGCVCENPPGLRLDTNNVELAATIAPRRPFARSTRCSAQPIACMRSGSRPNTTTIAIRARRCTPGWRGGCSMRPRTCTAQSCRSRRTRSRTYWSFIGVHCRPKPSVTWS